MMNSVKIDLEKENRDLENSFKMVKMTLNDLEFDYEKAADTRFDHVFCHMVS